MLWMQSIIVLTGLIAALAAPRFEILFLLLIFGPLALGMVFLFKSKFLLFRRGVWISWGPGKMDSRSRTYYFTGYVLMVIFASLAMAVYLRIRP